jgi:hypothetical protein
MEKWIWKRRSVHAFNQSRPSNSIALLSMTCGPHMPYISSPSLTFTHLQVDPTRLFSLFFSFLFSSFTLASHTTTAPALLFLACVAACSKHRHRQPSFSAPATLRRKWKNRLSWLFPPLPPWPIASMSYCLPQRRLFFTDEASIRRAFLPFPQPPLMVVVSYSRLFLREIKRRSKSSIPRHYSLGPSPIL